MQDIIKIDMFQNIFLESNTIMAEDGNKPALFGCQFHVISATWYAAAPWQTSKCAK